MRVKLRVNPAFISSTSSPSKDVAYVTNSVVIVNDGKLKDPANLETVLGIAMLRLKFNLCIGKRKHQAT